jgi:hypothetical protein
MKKIVIAILVLFPFSLILGCSGNEVIAAGDQNGTESPESMVTCWGADISERSVAGSIDVGQCGVWADECADCIMSLEDQGCKNVDIVVTHVRQDDGTTITARTYLLSCDGR